MGMISDLIHEINNNQKNYYFVYYKKKSNGTKRKIVVPNDLYRGILRMLNEKLGNLFNISENSFAWKKNTSRVDCVSRHVNKKNVLKIDISKFFDNITSEHIFKAINDSMFYEQIIDVFNKLEITVEDFINFVTILDHNRRTTAQGFPTSPLIANAVRYDIDMEIQKICTENSWVYSAYGDDLVISGDTLRGSYINDIVDIIYKHGFYVNFKKIAYMPYFVKQHALGITFNKKIKPDKEHSSHVIGKVIHAIKNNMDIDSVLMGMIESLSLAENKRDYNYLKGLLKRYEQRNQNN